MLKIIILQLENCTLLGNAKHWTLNLIEQGNIIVNLFIKQCTWHSVIQGYIDVTITKTVTAMHK